MSKIKKVLCLVVALTLSVSILSMGVSATEYKFTKLKIYGNKFVTCRTDKVTTDNKVNIRVDTIYKADGSSSDYSKIKIGLFNGATQVKSDSAITKGKTYNIEVEKKYQTTAISLNLKGNTTSLDAKVTGVSSGWK